MSFTWRVTSTEQNQILNESSSIIHLLHPTDKSIFSLTLFFLQSLLLPNSSGKTPTHIPIQLLQHMSTQYQTINGGGYQALRGLETEC